MPAPIVAIQFALAAPELTATRLRTWARAALPPRSGGELTLRLVGTGEARRLNHRYRGRDRATNVLSFAYGRRPLRGDIVLCLPLLRREARAQGKTLLAHCAHLVVHGVLHLRGYDHLRRRDAERMERRERVLLRGLGFADPYAPARIGTSARAR